MKDIKINLNASNASGEAYWRKRCDVIEAELTSLRADNAELKETVLTLQTEYVRQNPCVDPQEETDELRAEVERLKSSLRTIILLCGEAENANIHVISGEAQMALKREVRE